MDSLESELRESNYIFHEGEVIQINGKNFDILNSKMPEGVEGIELSINWLENFGFLYHTHNNHSSIFFLNGIKLIFRDVETDVYFQNNLIKTLYYVHELQNLYNALTGEELIYQDR